MHVRACVRVDVSVGLVRTSYACACVRASGCKCGAWCVCPVHVRACVRVDVSVGPGAYVLCMCVRDCEWM